MSRKFTGGDSQQIGSKVCTSRAEGMGSEETARHDWTWDSSSRSSSVHLVQFNTQIIFHPTYSSGTAAVFGSFPLTYPHHHYWEVAMLSPVYGTDVMVGLATKGINLSGHTHSFASVVGHDAHSWGFSYHGFVQHGGQRTDYGRKWGQGDKVGVHLDTWRGTVEFYLNREPLGIAFRGLLGKGDMFPLVSSTAAKSEMKLVTAQSFVNNLQFSCLKILSDKLPGSSILKLLLPPGLKNFIQNNYWFFINLQKEEEGGLVIAPESLQDSSAATTKPQGKKFAVKISSPRKRGLKEISDSSETDENDSFLVRPKRFRKAKLALMNKCQKRPALDESGNSSQDSPECFSQDVNFGEDCPSASTSNIVPTVATTLGVKDDFIMPTPQRKKKFKLRRKQ